MVKSKLEYILAVTKELHDTTTELYESLMDEEPDEDTEAIIIKMQETLKYLKSDIINKDI